MNKSFSITILMIFALGFVVAGMGRAMQGQDDDEGPMSHLRFLVVKDYNGKPIRNAAVVLHPVTKKGKQAMGGLELKTDNDGRTNIDGIPYGPLRVQVLAEGFRTFGQDYEINKPELEIMVKLQRPVRQYSTMDGTSDTKKPDDKSQPNQKPQQ
ncbi:MAG: carboxypeptidase-like regulatory domain-containing protein [Terriglobales bacterium]